MCAPDVTTNPIKTSSSRSVVRCEEACYKAIGRALADSGIGLTINDLLGTRWCRRYFSLWKRSVRIWHDKVIVFAMNAVKRHNPNDLSRFEPRPGTDDILLGELMIH